MSEDVSDLDDYSDDREDPAPHDRSPTPNRVSEDPAPLNRVPEGTPMSPQLGTMVQTHQIKIGDPDFSPDELEDPAPRSRPADINRVIWAPKILDSTPTALYVGAQATFDT